MAEKLILYHGRGACELQPDMEHRVVWISFAEAVGPWSAPQRGQRRYQWEDRITLALSAEEATDLALAARLAQQGQLGELFSIHHDPAGSEGAGGAPKTLVLRSGDRESRGATVLETRQGHRRITIVLDKGDLFRLETLLPQAVASMLGWR